MKRILILGAGKSASRIISYLLKKSETHNWKITVGDLDQQLAEKKVNGHPNGSAVQFDINNAKHREKYISEVDIVASLLPFVFHSIVAKDCLKFGKHLVTASYVDKESMALNDDFEKAGLLFMGEIGLDPGIDHLATMKMLDTLKAKGGDIKAVYSFAGALIHPDHDTNPWNYKFTWAPMNVVKAGQGVSQYLHEFKPKYIPYNRVFASAEDRQIGDLGWFEVYPNRNSTKYIEKYDLESDGIGTFLRGTLRRKGFCSAWNSFVKLGWTDGSYKIDVEGATYNDFVQQFIPVEYLQNDKTLKEALADFLGLDMKDEIMDKLTWLGIFDNQEIGLTEASPADILCKLLAEKWSLEPGDKDMIVMLHEVVYKLNGEKRKLSATLINMGEDEENTAISKLVGLPSGIMVKLIATEQISLTGVRIPIMPEVYNPILDELKEYGVGFEETDTVIS